MSSRATAPVTDAPSSASGVDDARELVLPITGMTCANCAGTVERTLRKASGVREATVSYASERATVRFDPGVVSPEALVEAVERAGYGALLVEESAIEEAEEHARAEEVQAQRRADSIRRLATPTIG